MVDSGWPETWTAMGVSVERRGGGSSPARANSSDTLATAAGGQAPLPYTTPGIDPVSDN